MFKLGEEKYFSVCSQFGFFSYNLVNNFCFRSLVACAPSLVVGDWFLMQRSNSTIEMHTVTKGVLWFLLNFLYCFPDQQVVITGLSQALQRSYLGQILSQERRKLKVAVLISGTGTFFFKFSKWETSYAWRINILKTFSNQKQSFHFFDQPTIMSLLLE